MRLQKNEILFVFSNSFDVVESKNFGFKCAGSIDLEFHWILSDPS